MDKDDLKEKNVTGQKPDDARNKAIQGPQNPDTRPHAASQKREDEKKKLEGEEKEEDPKQMLGKMQDVLKEYNNEESSIPLDHEYWNIANKHRATLNKPEPKK